MRRPCRCGHVPGDHAQHRRGTGCRVCGVSCLRYQPARSRAAAVATYSVGLLLLAAGIALALALLLGGAVLVACGALIATWAMTHFYSGAAADMWDEAYRDRSRARAVASGHPSAPVDWDRALVHLLADEHGREAA